MYIASQIIIWIVLAALFGFAIGWMAKSRGGLRVKRRRRY